MVFDTVEGSTIKLETNTAFNGYEGLFFPYDESNLSDKTRIDFVPVGGYFICRLSS